MPQLIQSLPEGPVDIIGDVHGEAEALHRLLYRLGCNPAKGTAQRPIVFVGDLVDRGPDSPEVVETVMHLVHKGLAHCVLGNHELNILLGSTKEGNGWFWSNPSDGFQIQQRDAVQHHPFSSAAASPAQADRFRQFFETLPLGMARPDLRVVHACWHTPTVESLPESGDVRQLTIQWAEEIRRELKHSGIIAKEKKEREAFGGLTRLDIRPSHDLPAHAHAAQTRQSRHPIKVLTSGKEVRVPFEEMFYVGGKWRLVRRQDWWNTYDEAPAVVVGHYWRRRGQAWVTGKPDAWSTNQYTDWAGPKKNVFCVDYSAGLRFKERLEGRADGFDGGLAAMRWPERTLVFDDMDAPVPTHM